MKITYDDDEIVIDPENGPRLVLRNWRDLTQAEKALVRGLCFALMETEHGE
jgi:hypothetical protein